MYTSYICKQHNTHLTQILSTKAFPAKVILSANNQETTGSWISTFSITKCQLEWHVLHCIHLFPSQWSGSGCMATDHFMTKKFPDNRNIDCLSHFLMECVYDVKCHITLATALPLKSSLLRRLWTDWSIDSNQQLLTQERSTHDISASLLLQSKILTLIQQNTFMYHTGGWWG